VVGAKKAGLISLTFLKQGSLDGWAVRSVFLLKIAVSEFEVVVAILEVGGDSTLQSTLLLLCGERLRSSLTG